MFPSLWRRLAREEGAQATTEFVIAFPIVLFMLIATLQLIVLVNVVQVGHYAAFCAARSLAVQLAADSSAEKEGAVKKAKIAAAIAYAPVSQPVSGESTLGIVGELTETVSSYASDWLQDTLGLDAGLIEMLTTIFSMDSGDLYEDLEIPELDEIVDDELQPLLWIYIAANRMGADGFEWELAQVDGTEVSEAAVELTYGYPLSLTGFAGMWNHLWGASVDQAFTTILGHPLVPVETKSATGYEPWSGTVIVEDGTESSGTTTGTGYDGEIGELYGDLSNISSNLTEASEELEELQEKLDECLDDADDADERQDCHDTWDPKIEDKEDEIEDLQDQYDETQEELNDLAEDSIDDTESAIDGACD